MTKKGSVGRTGSQTRPLDKASVECRGEENGILHRLTSGHLGWSPYIYPGHQGQIGPGLQSQRCTGDPFLTTIAELHDLLSRSNEF